MTAEAGSEEAWDGAPAPPQVVIIAGPNGSGKSTLIERGGLIDVGLTLPDAYVNADDLGRSEGLSAEAAQKRSRELRRTGASPAACGSADTTCRRTRYEAAMRVV